LDAGVDVATQEEPRNWLERTPEIRPLDPSTEPEPLPSTLEAFRQWLAGPDAPLASARSKPVLPDGAEGAEIMLLCEPPTRDELAAGQPIGGEAAIMK
jgi:DNA polymerase